MFWRRRGLTPDQTLANAIAHDDLALASALLEGGANANVRDPRGVPILCIATSKERPDAVCLLLKHGADPNSAVHAPERGLHRTPALQLSAANGSLPTFRALIAAGADLTATDPTGVTALMSAAYMGHAEIVSELIAAGAPLERRGESGYTALMFASNAGHAGAVRALIEGGARTDAVDNQGSTPIMFAAQHGHDAVITILLAADADPHALGTHGLSAVGFAKQNQHESTLRLLTAGKGA